MNIEKNEEAFNLLFSKRVKFKNYDLYYDEQLTDMYDHNYFYVTKMDDEILSELTEENIHHKFEHFKIESSNQLPYLINKRFEESCTLTMLKEDYHDFNIPQILDIKYHSIKEIDNSEDLIYLEDEYYGELYGHDFLKRKMTRYLTTAKQNQGLDYISAIYNNKLIASCYVFYSNDCVCIDDLLVRDEYRHKYVASNLLKHIGLAYNCPIFLHADNDDTPKDMYEKLGFKVVNKTYEYLKMPQKNDC